MGVVWDMCCEHMCYFCEVWLAILMNPWWKGTIYTRKSRRQLTEKYFSVKEKEVTDNTCCYWDHVIIRGWKYTLNFITKQQPTNRVKLNPLWKFIPLRYIRLNKKLGNLITVGSALFNKSRLITLHREERVSHCCPFTWRGKLMKSIYKTCTAWEKLVGHRNVLWSYELLLFIYHLFHMSWRWLIKSLKLFETLS